MDQAVGAVHQVFALERLHDLVGAHFAAQPFGERLHGLGELHQHRARQGDAEVLFEHEADAALAGLAVDAHRLLVGGTDVGRVDGQVRHLPMLPIHLRHALLDGVLVRAGEGREDQIARVGVAFVDRQLVDGLDGFADARHVAEIQLRVDALGEQVHGDGDDIAVAGALAVAEERAFDPLGARHQREFGGRHAGAAVVVGVQADDDALAFGEVADEPLDLVGVDVRRRHLHGGGQVDDDRLGGGGAPFVGNRGGDFHGEVEFGAGEALRRILELHVGAGKLAHTLLHHRRAFHGEGDDASAVQLEDDAALQRGGGVVEVEDRFRRPVEGFDRAFDEFGAGLAEHLDGDFLGHHAAVDDGADEVEVRLRGGREAGLDLDEADFEEQLEEAQLFVHVHGIDQGLVAVAQVHAAPARRRVEDVAGPAAVRQNHRRKGVVLGERHGALAAADPGRGGGGAVLRVHHGDPLCMALPAPCAAWQSLRRKVEGSTVG